MAVAKQVDFDVVIAGGGLVGLSLAAVLGKADAYDRDRGPLKPWFLRVVRNRCIDRLLVAGDHDFLVR